MSGDSRLTPLRDVRPGMVSGDMLRDANGNVLLAQGVVLTEQTLAALARHHIASLPILQATAPAPDEAVVQIRLDYLFRGNDHDDRNDGATGTLRRYVEDYRLPRKVAP
jgi:hypothetical protein